MQLPYFDADAVRRVLSFPRAMRAIEQSLLDEVDPELDSPRLFSPAPNGEFLLMPSQGSRFSGVKALTVAPNNPARGFEKIQGVYVLYSSDTLTPVAVLEASSLTAIRTPAVVLTAVRHLARAAPLTAELPARPRILVFGAGVQARAHIHAAHTIYPNAEFTLVSRGSTRARELQAECEATGIEVSDLSHIRASAVSRADIIFCATTASTPLFDGAEVKEAAIVTAIGTHGRQQREVDDHFVSRADVVVEGRASAQRENGNLSNAWQDRNWQVAPPSNLRDLVRGTTVRRPGHPAFYTGVGMAWEDLVCAQAVFNEGTPSA